MGPHHHLDEVILPDGTSVWAASFPIDGYDRGGALAPDTGLYLDPHWAPPWPHRHLDWPDFELPVDVGAMVDGLNWVLAGARAGQRVEIGCIGGHGRTGTALACLATMAGGRRWQATDPVQWVRQTYCRDAIETDQQAAFARRFRPGP